MELKRSAEEHGPGSEAARRYRHLQFLGGARPLPSSGEAVIAIPPDGRDCGWDVFFSALGSAKRRGLAASSAATRASARSGSVRVRGRCRVRDRLEVANARGGDRTEISGVMWDAG